MQNNEKDGKLPEHKPNNRNKKANCHGWVVVLN